MAKDWRGVGVVSALSVAALAVAGYHPYAEDGGLYVAGVEKLLDPALFRGHAEFVLAPMRYSVFAPVVAGLVRGTHLPLEWVLLMLYCASVWATLGAAWMLAGEMVVGWVGRVGAVVCLACVLTMPVAGTSLMLMDPYVTARSFSGPLVLLALAWALKRRWAYVGAALVGAACMHPLMAGYGMAAVMSAVVGRGTSGAKAPFFGMSEMSRLKPGPTSKAKARGGDGIGSESKARLREAMEGWRGFALSGALATGVAAALQWSAPAESPAYVQVAMTRYYWFPFRWQWYELVGLVAPLLVIWKLGGRTVLGRAAIGLGCVSLGVAAVFARAGMATHAVARLQPLRCFGVVYTVMLLLLGAWAGEHLWKWRRWSAAVMFAVLGLGMFAVQRGTYPASNHFEWPGAAVRNRWEQAFRWVRANTPKDALFALDARYITRGRDEDAQCFRAIAERSALADYSKDGGEAAVAPDLTAAWVEGETAQSGLEAETDAVRTAKLRPRGVGWVVLERGSGTGWTCPYANDRVEVCRVP